MRATDELDLYLMQERKHGFTWDSLRNGDCMLFLLGWAELIGWEGVGKPWRGLYASAEEARSLLDRRGGLYAAGCDAFGPPRMGSEERRGDVGFLERDGWGLGLICTGSMWVMRAGERGIRLTHRRPDVCWNLRFA